MEHILSPQKRFLILFFFLLFQSLYATHMSFNERMKVAEDGTLVKNGDVKSIVAYSSQDPGWNSCTKYFKDRITLGVDHSCYTFIPQNYTVSVELSVTVNTCDNAQCPYTFTTVLEVNYAPFDAPTSTIIPFKDKSAYTFNHAIDYTFEVKGIQINGVGVDDLPANLFIDGDIEVDRYCDMKLAEDHLLSFTTKEVLHTGCDNVSQSSDGGEINLIWSPCLQIGGAFVCPEEYQLEWTYVNDYDISLGAYKDEGLLTYNFKNNNTRITTKENHYTISSVFEHGYVVFRVRPVGVDPEGNLNIPIYGNWSIPEAGALNDDKVYISASHEQNKNWQYAASYAEEGKRKEVINYFDGSLRAHETVTKVSSDTNTIVGQTLYDFQGRPAVNILPAPVNCNDEETIAFGFGPPLKYYVRFNKADDGSSNEFSKNYFDVDNPSSQCSTPSPLGLSDQSGASNYFSNANPNKSNFQAYVPDAETFPFSQTEYTPDNTGRIKEKGDVGRDFRLGADGHTTKYLYGKPDQVQLDRMFGSEAGDATNYKKNIVIDPNGQSSVTYLDNQGRTVATALAGDGPSDASGPILEELAEIGNANKEVIVNLLSNKSSDTLSNQVEGDSVVFSAQLLVAYKSDYEFNYSLDVPLLPESCLNTGTCFSCVYDLSIQLTDKCGNEIRPDASNQPDKLVVGGQVTVVNGVLHFNPSCSVANTIYGDNTHPPLNLYYSDLEPGEYTISKVLTVNSAARDSYVEKFLNTSYNHCLVPKTNPSVDLSGCNILDDCSGCEAALGTRNDWINTGKGTGFDYDYLMEKCLEPCKVETWCEGAYEKMLADVSPNGQYGDYTNPNEPLSVFNLGNSLPTNLDVNNNIVGQNHWKNPQVLINGTYYSNYLDPDGSISKIDLFFNGIKYIPELAYTGAPVYSDANGYYTYPQFLKNIEDFVLSWRTSWAKSLVRMHPEYEYYKYCLEIDESNKFDVKLLNAETFEEAVAANLISPASSNSTPSSVYFMTQDPYLNNGPRISLIHLYNQYSFPHDHVSQFQNRFSGYMPDIGNTGANWSMVKASAYTARCGTQYGSTAVGSCIDFGTNYNTDAALNTKIRNREWVLLKSAYLSEKRKEQMKEADLRAIAAYSGGYNGCFSNGNFDPIASGMYFFSSFPGLTAMFSPCFKYKQPCSVHYKDLYIGKKKCFMGEQDIIPEDSPTQEEVQYEIYQQTGQCPNVMHVNAFLNAIISDGKLTHAPNATPLSLSLYPEFTKELYNTVVSSTTYTPCYYSAVVSNQGSTITITIAGQTSKTIVLNLNTANSSFDWSEVTGMVNFKWISTSGSTSPFDYNITADLEVTDALGIHYTPINGSTKIDLENCTFNEVCKPNDLAKDLQKLFSALAGSSQFAYDANYNIPSPIDIGPSSYYDPFITNNIRNVLGITNSTNLKWELTFNNADPQNNRQYEIYVSSNPNKKLIIHFEDLDVACYPTIPSLYPTPNNPPTIPIQDFDPLFPSIFGFKLIKGDYLNYFKIAAFNEYGKIFTDFRGTVTLYDPNLTPPEKGIEMGACGLPLPQKCKEDAYQLKTDLFELLKDISPSIANQSSIDLTTSYKFTNLIKSYFPHGLTSTTSNFSSASADYQIEFEIQAGFNSCEFKLWSSEDLTKLTSITKLFLSGSPDNDGNYYEFNCDATFTINGIAHTGIIFGKSCLPLKECDPCFRNPPPPCIPCQNFTIHYPSSVEAGNSFTLSFDSPSYNCDLSGYTISVNYGDGSSNTSNLTHTYSGEATYEVKISISKGVDCEPVTKYIYIVSTDEIQERKRHDRAAKKVAMDSRKLIVSKEFSSLNSIPKFISTKSSSKFDKLTYPSAANERIAFKETANFSDTILQNSYSGNNQIPQGFHRLSNCEYPIGSCEDWYYCIFPEIIDNYNIWALSNNYSQIILPSFSIFQQYCECAPNYAYYLQNFYMGIWSGGIYTPPPAVELAQFPPCKDNWTWTNYVECKASHVLFDKMVAKYNAYASGGYQLTPANLGYLQIGVLPNGGIEYEETVDYLTRLNVCACVQKYAGYMYTVINTPRTITPDIFDSLKNVSLFCAKKPTLVCVPEPADQTASSPISIPEVDPCEEQQLHIAGLNNDEAYKKYILFQKNKITSAYNRHCLHALHEKLNERYFDKEYHYTLYYYDQAGNLVRTVPPEGVRLLSTSTEFDAVKDDRENNTHNFSTSHTLYSTYEYNSLNQLIRQSIPDHDKMDVFELTLPNGLDSRLEINSTQFVSTNKGYLTGYATIDNIERGMLYTTDDGGLNWTLVSNTVTTDLKKVQRVVENKDYLFAIGNHGIVLRSTDGHNWDMIPLYSKVYDPGLPLSVPSNVTEIGLNDLYFKDEYIGVIVGDLGLVFYTTDGGVNFQLGAGIPADENITSVKMDYLENWYATANKNGLGSVYISTDGGHTWTRENNYQSPNLEKLSFISNTEGFAAGDDGTLLKTINGGTTWDFIESKTAGNFMDVYFYNATLGIAIQKNSNGLNQLWKTSNGGNDWTLFSNATDHYNQLYFKAGDAYGYAVGSNSKLVHISLNPFVLSNISIIPSNLDITASYPFVATTTYTDMWIGTADGRFGYLQNVNGGNVVCSIYNSNTNLNFKSIICSSNNSNEFLALSTSGELYKNELLLGSLTGNSIYSDINDIQEYSNYVYGYCATTQTMVELNKTNLSFNNNLSSHYNGSIKSFISLNNSHMMLASGTAGAILEMNKQSGDIVPKSSDNINPLELEDIYISPDNPPFKMVVGKDGMVLYQSERGAPWNVLTEGIVNDIKAINFTDHEIGLMAGNGGKIWRIAKPTINTNLATEVLNVPSNNNLNDIVLSTNYKAYACGNNGTILYFNDYTNPNNAPILAGLQPANCNFSGLCFKKDLSSIISVGNGSSIFKYAGNAGMQLKNIFPVKLNEVNFSSLLDGYVVGDYSFIRYTNSGASNWQSVPNNIDFYNTNVIAVTAFKAAKARILQNSGNSLKLNGTNFVSGSSLATTAVKIRLNASENGWAVGSASAGIEQITTTAGVTTSQWRAVSGSNGAVFNNLQMVSEKRVIVSGNAGYFLAMDISNSSNPSYNVWNLYPAQNLNDLMAVHFFDTKNGYAVGKNGKLFRYHSNLSVYSHRSYSGNDWTQPNLTDEWNSNPSDININCLSFSSRSKCFIGGKNYLTHANYARVALDETGRYSSRFWYDRLGRMVLSQNTKQYSENKKYYSYTLYDELGRISEVGELHAQNAQTNNNFPIRKIFGDIVDDAFNPAVINKTKFEEWIQLVDKVEVTHTFYDKAIYTLPINQENLRSRVSSVIFEKVYDPEHQNYASASHYSYDIHGNVKTLLQENKEVPVEMQKFKKTEYKYDLISGKVNEVDYQRNYSDQFYHKYDYDADNRLTEVKTSRDKTFWSRDAKYFYYKHGPLARVELGENKVQGIDYAYTLQGWIKGVNSNQLLPYNDLGHDGIYNSPLDEHPQNRYVAADVFGYTLGYFEGDYHSIDRTMREQDTYFELYTRNNAIPYHVSNLLDARHNLYNGNISHMVTSLMEPVQFLTGNREPYNIPKYILGSAYNYDQLNRLIKTNSFSNQNGLFWEFSNNNGLTSNGSMYSNIFSYDANGNILTQSRNDETGTTFDDLEYGYNKDASTNLLQNRLYHIKENILPYKRVDDIDGTGIFKTDHINDQTPYKYDELGNLRFDEEEEIENIEWTVSGKIKQIIRPQGSTKHNLSFDYDPSGNRIAKHESDSYNNFIQSTYYTRDAQGNIMATYANKLNTVTETESFKLLEHDIYGSSRLGTDITPIELIGNATPFGDYSPEELEAITLETESSTYSNSNTLGLKQYECTNHLGNVLATITDYKIPLSFSDGDFVDYNEAKLITASDYYPFGAPMPARTFHELKPGNIAIKIDRPLLSSENLYIHTAGGSGTIEVSGGYPTVETYVEEIVNYFIANNIPYTRDGNTIFVDNWYNGIDNWIDASPKFGFLNVSNAEGGGYRFGFNGMEKDDEVKGGGNSYTTLHRIYDPRLGRWFSVDPEVDEYPDESPYAAMENNPISETDPDGDCPWCVAFIKGAVQEYATQVIMNVAEGKSIGDALTDVDGGEILESAVIDGLTLGVGSLVSKAQTAVKVVKAADKIVDAEKAAVKVNKVAKTTEKVSKVEKNLVKAEAKTQKTYQTYTKQPKNPKDGVYSGKTSGKGTPEQNVANRDKNHHMNETHGPAKLDKSSSNSDAIRGREQNLIDKNGGAKKQRGTSGNTNRGVAEKNKNAQKYDNAAKKEFGK
ncbi:MAG: hypothetical protein IPP32_12700 [Bacteroidetes bacterium]|nr:hypothetical protein [Bacteroidota bacterium]